MDCSVFCEAAVFWLEVDSVEVPHPIKPRARNAETTPIISVFLFFYKISPSKIKICMRLFGLDFCIRFKPIIVSRK